MSLSLLAESNSYPLLDLFWAFAPPATTSAAELAPRMALRTRILADRIRERLDGDADLQGFYEAFSEHLLAGLTREGFAERMWGVSGSETKAYEPPAVVKGACVPDKK